MRLLRWLGVSKSLLSVEGWAVEAARVTTPDDLIAAAIIQSFATDYESWSFTSGRPKRIGSPNSGIASPERLLRSGNKPVTILAQRLERSRDSDCMAPWVDAGYELTINGIPIEAEVAKRIMAAWGQAKEAHDRAKAVALEAKRSMELNEQKWNLAEEFFGFKRTPEGALLASTGQHSLSCGGKHCHDVSCVGTHSLLPEQS